MTFSVPAAPDYSNLNEKIQKDEDISPLFKEARDSKKTVVSFAAFDIASAQYRVVTVAHPLLIGDRVEGVVFWEYNL